MISYKYTISILSLITLVVGIAEAKSLYVINNTETSELQAYRIEDANLVYQINYFCQSDIPGGTGAVGIAIDTDSQFLFVTFEDENKIELVNAKTMQYEDIVTAPGASNLAGIVVDNSKQKIYVVDRGKKYLYVYNWYPRIPSLVLDGDAIELEGLTNNLVGGAWDLALDEENERLWVTSNETKVRFYDTNDWSHNPNTDYIMVSHSAVGIFLDLANGYVYTGTSQMPPVSTLLSQYDLSDNNESTVDVGSYVLGITVSQDTSCVYITTYGTGSSPNRLIIYDSNLVKQTWESGDIGNPAGVCVPSGDVSYKPPRFYLEKVDVNEPNAVFPEDYITYEITYGPNGVDHNDVVITDYLPAGVYFISASDPNMTYDPFTDANIVTWQIGSLDANAPNDFVTLTVVVNYLAEPMSKIRNYCEIENDLYCSFATADTNVSCWGGNIIYVDEDANGYNNGTSWANAYLDLQDALDRAAAGCGSKIWVAAGTYRPSKRADPDYHRSATFQLVDDVAIYGGFPSGGGVRRPNIHCTTLSGDIGTEDDPDDNSYHVIKCENISNAIIDGFTITAGNADNADSTAKFDYCFGGGMYCYNSSPTITNCIFSENNAYGGGGMCNDYYSNPNITNCIFIDNSAFYIGLGSGGGIYNYSYSSPIITNCTFIGNSTSGSGGGMYNDYSSPNISNCVFIGNSTVYGDGGAIYNYWESSPIITNCTFRGNSATYEGYTCGGGMYNKRNSSPEVTNCIFWGNYASDGNEIYNYDDSSVPTFSYCDINDCGAPGNWDVNLGTDGGGNIEADPCFYDPNDPNSYHLTADSNCIDAGDPNGNYDGETDIDGEDRVKYGRVDIGADEYYWSPADFNDPNDPNDHDGIVNFIDYAKFALALDANFGEPNYNDIYDLNDNNSIDYNDLALFCKDWLWQAGWLKTFPAGMGAMGSGMGQGIGQSLGLTEASYSSAVVEQQPAQLTQVDIEDILKWLEELWLDPEVRKVITEDEWLKFVESVKSELE